MTQFTFGLLGAFNHGRGFPQASVVANPAVATGISYRVGSSYWERLLSLAFTLVTDANAANRTVTLSILNEDGLTAAAVPTAAVQAASLTRVYTYLPNVSVASGPVGSNYLTPLPQMFLPPMWTVAVTIGAVQAGDQISAVMLNRERFVTGDAGYPIGTVDTETDAATKLVEAAALSS